MIQNKIYDIKQTAEFLNLKVSRVRYMVFRKQIPHLKIGKSIRFDVAKITEWLLEKSIETGKALK